MPLDDILGYVSAATGVMGSLCLIAYKAFSRRSNSIKTAKHMRVEDLPGFMSDKGPSISSGGTYVAVEGEVKCDNPVLTQYSAPKDQPVAYYYLNEQRKDAKLFLGRELYTTTSAAPAHKIVPFYLAAPNGETKVSVPDIKSAVSDQLHFPLDALEQVSKAHYESKFTPDEVLQHVARGTVPKGVTYTERVLPVGARLTILGHVIKDKDGNLSFSTGPRIDGGELEPFIVSRNGFGARVLGALEATRTG